MITFRKRLLAASLFQLAIPLCLAIFSGRTPLIQGGQKPLATPPAKQIPAKPAPSSADEEAQALEQAIASARGNPQALIENLQNFLMRFPASARREQVLRTILKEALQSNDPNTAVATAQKLLEISPGDPAPLSTLVELLGQRSDPVNLQNAVRYATQFIERSEKLGGQPKPSDVPAEKWPETQALMRASGYLMRGKIYAMSGESEKALADYEKSYTAYPTSQVAERLGDLAAKTGMTDRAIGYYATAFVFPDKSVDPAHRDQLRRKLGSLYVDKYHSEKGLGELMLARYDQLILALKSRFEPSEAPNAGGRDPFDYVLKRPEGPLLRLADYRGKILVMDFWATWCGPCRVEGKLLERVMVNLRREPGVAFLAVNVDEDRNGVSDFIKQEGWTVPVVYGQGIDHLLGVRALPTLVVFDRNGRVVFRQVGLDPGSFTETVEKTVRAALASLPKASPNTP